MNATFFEELSSDRDLTVNQWLFFRCKCGDVSQGFTVLLGMELLSLGERIMSKLMSKTVGQQFLNLK